MAVLRILIKVKAFGSGGYLGVAVDASLPSDFVNTKYNVATLTYVSSENKYVAEYQESRDFPDGRHFIIISTTTNHTLDQIGIWIYDSVGNLVLLDMRYGTLSLAEQYCMAFEISGTTIRKLVDYTGPIPVGEAPFTPDKPAVEMPTDLFGGMGEMMKQMMSMVMNMMMMMAVMQVMVGMVGGLSQSIPYSI